MNNILCWVTGFGFAVGSLIALSGSSAIALINQDTTSLNHLNISTFNGVLEKQKISGENAQKVYNNSNINKTHIQDKNTVDKQEHQNFTRGTPSKKLLLAGCGYDEDGYRVCR